MMQATATAATTVHDSSSNGKSSELELSLFRESARRFFQTEIRPNSEAWRKAGIVDREAFTKAGELGFLCMWAAEEYGGAGIEDFRYEQVLIEENAFHGDSGFFMSAHSRLIGPYLGNFGSEEQKARFLPGCVSGDVILAVAMTEPDAGSDLAGTKTRAEEQGDHWLLNGQKTYISNGILADLVVVAAKTDPDNAYAMTLFLVERDMPGFERGRNLEKMGLKSQDTAELFFHDVKVPKRNVLGTVGGGFYHLMSGLAEERLIAAVGNLASAKYAAELTKTYVKERHAFGRPLSRFQNTRFKLAELDTDIEVAQVYVDHCVSKHNAGDLGAVEAARLKLFTSELNGRAVDLGVQLHGGAGYMEEFPICRLYQDERIGRIAAGTSEIMKEIIAREILD